MRMKWDRAFKKPLPVGAICFVLAAQYVLAQTRQAVEREERETRAPDKQFKNLHNGQMEILMTDDIRGTLDTQAHVRPPANESIPNFEPEIYPGLHHSRADSEGANLRSKSSDLAAAAWFLRCSPGGRA